jgi:hypothetical protein
MPNGSSSLNGSAPPKSKKAIVREVREGLEGVLEAIASTVGIVRDVFRDRGQGDPSLMSRVLSFIQSDVPAPDTSLPSELQMSTHHLLSTLPSASHFALFPGPIRSYKPYVDLTSVMSSLSPAQLGLRLSEWFSKSVAELRNVTEGWFAELRTLKEVWAVRSWFNDWLQTKELEEGEKQELAQLLDDVTHGQAVKIMRTALKDLQDDFRDGLQNALLQLRDSTSEALLGTFTGVGVHQRSNLSKHLVQRVLLQSSYSNLSYLHPLTLVWEGTWFRPSANTNQRFGSKSLVEHLYSIKSCLPLRTAQRLYKTTQRGKHSRVLISQSEDSHIRMRCQKADGKIAWGLRAACGRLLQSHSLLHLFELGGAKLWDW